MFTDTMPILLCEDPRSVDTSNETVEHGKRHARSAHYLVWKLGGSIAYLEESVKLVKEVVSDILSYENPHYIRILRINKAVRECLEVEGWDHGSRDVIS